MPQVIAIIGLPGAGKTTLGKELQEEFGFRFFDDPRKEDRKRVLKALEAGEDLIIADPTLCIPAFFQEFEKAVNDYDVRFIFFEADVDQCRKNVIRCDDDRVESTLISLRRFSKTYKVPEDAVDVRKVPAA